ncbi:MAG TPA: hypothetical protein VHF87_22190 [Methylomirabilota bacterium]|jgi:hypothetical protein|nr:hypothetical protein [Methylomirabilota bacterium]
MMTLVTGIIGIALLVAFLGVLVWWIKALPFTIIVVAVVLMAVWDFVQTVRSSNGAAGAEAARRS